MEVLHRPKIEACCVPFNLMVARPVGRAEIARNPKAQESMNKEWSRLRAQGVWDVNTVRERSSVAAEARNSNKNVQFGRLHGICVEKNSELEDGHPSRKFTRRVVFLGNQVRTQNYEAAVFQDQGKASGTMEAPRGGDPTARRGGGLFHQLTRGRLAGRARAAAAGVAGAVGGGARRGLPPRAVCVRGRGGAGGARRCARGPR